MMRDDRRSRVDWSLTDDPVALLDYVVLLKRCVANGIQ